MTAKAHDCVRTFPNGDGIAAVAGTRVKNNSGNLALAGQLEDELGILEHPLLAGDAYGSVRFLAEDTTVHMVASEAFAAYADLYRAASGKVADTQGGTSERIGVALEAASGDGSIVEVLPKRLADVT